LGPCKARVSREVLALQSHGSQCCRRFLARIFSSKIGISHEFKMIETQQKMHKHIVFDDSSIFNTIFNSKMVIAYDFINGYDD
jgi:hypothetical protein